MTADILESTNNGDTVYCRFNTSCNIIATGYKSNTGFIGTLPNIAIILGVFLPKEARYPIAYIIKAVCLAGKSIGIIAIFRSYAYYPSFFFCLPSRT